MKLCSKDLSHGPKYQGVDRSNSKGWRWRCRACARADAARRARVSHERVRAINRAAQERHYRRKGRAPWGSAEHLAKLTKHGLSRSGEYRIFMNMKQRCTNPNVKGYPHYGGRGIEVRFTFEEFYEHVGSRPGPEYSIDRIDVDGHYEVGNVRWATYEEQERNKRVKRGPMPTTAAEAKAVADYLKAYEARRDAA